MLPRIHTTLLENKSTIFIDRETHSRYCLELPSDKYKLCQFNAGLWSTFEITKPKQLIQESLVLEHNSFPKGNQGLLHSRFSNCHPYAAPSDAHACLVRIQIPWARGQSILFRSHETFPLPSSQYLPTAQTCFEMALHELGLSSLSAVEEPALSFPAKHQRRRSSCWRGICRACAEESYIHRHLEYVRMPPEREIFLSHWTYLFFIYSIFILGKKQTVLL